MNQYPESAGMHSNIGADLLIEVVNMSGLKQKDAERKILFYSYAVLCSQVYLEKFKGALYTPNQSDDRARVPFVSDKQLFLKLSSYGEKIANLEKIGHDVDNILEYDYDAICSNIPVDFKINVKKLFDDINEELVLEDDKREVRIYCPLLHENPSLTFAELLAGDRASAGSKGTMPETESAEKQRPKFDPADLDF